MGKHGTRGGIKKDCTCPRAKHVHGTRVAYVVDGCGCPPCTEANRRYFHQNLLNHSSGRHAYTDAGPVRAHIEFLQSRGMGRRSIAKAAGVPQSVLTTLLYGRNRGDGKERRPPTGRILKTHAASILALDPELHGGANVEGFGASRRLQALAARGWPLVTQVEMLSPKVSPSTVHRILEGKAEFIYARVDEAISELYRSLADVEPAADTPQRARAIRATRAKAGRRGWPPPAAWDDETIDDPEARPDPSWKSASRIGSMVEDLADLVRFGEGRESAARRLGISTDGIYQGCQRAGRLDLWEQLVVNESL